MFAVSQCIGSKNSKDGARETLTKDEMADAEKRNIQPPARTCEKADLIEGAELRGL